MADSLTTIISKTQATLGDDGTRFATAIVTAACRLALKDFNAVCPVNAGTLEDVVADQKEYVLSGSDYANLIAVLDVLKNDDDGDDHESLTYDAYFEDNAPVIRLRSAESSGFLIVRFTQPQTVNGLDSATESTLPAWLDPVLLDGVCYYSLVVRAAGRVEPINLNRDVTRMYDDLKATFKLAFDLGLARVGQRRSPVGEPDTRAWNDEWYGQNVWG
jgi:hypothetical protein